jgi:hypothetical protein
MTNLLPDSNIDAFADASRIRNHAVLVGLCGVAQLRNEDRRETQRQPTGSSRTSIYGSTGMGVSDSVLKFDGRLCSRWWWLWRWRTMGGREMTSEGSMLAVEVRCEIMGRRTVSSLVF